MTSRLFSYACAGFLLVALLLGGASRVELLAPDIVALTAIPLLGWAVWRLRAAPLEGRERLPLAILAGCFLVGLIQLVPLPPGLWSSLPGHGAIASQLAAAGVERGWAPISLSPQATGAALLALIPAVALFLASRTLDRDGRRLLVLILLAVTVVSALIGGLQIIGGPESPLRFYEVTNPNPAVGFFANRNHLATLFASAVPFAALEALEAASRRPAARVRLLVMLALLALLAAGIAMTQSRSGFLLLALGILGSLAMTWRSDIARERGRLILGLIGLVAVVGALAAPLLFAQTFDRFGDGLSSDMRVPVAGVALKAAWAYAPFGSGLGTFVPVYMMFETPASMQNTYVNHAHDDWLELLVEAGLMAMAVIAVFLFWAARTALRAWRRTRTSGGPVVCAASLAILLLLAHSLVDYPLRTPAMMCVFALCCGLMISPRQRAATSGSSTGRDA
ncbi:MAG: O-antigen ligase family protein [Caulobacter sp.]|nr:O-antigen ligase family protein [Caulobacter sp.]